MTTELNQAELIKLLIAEHLGLSIDDIKDESDLTNLGADSLDGVEIIMALEDEFSIEICDEDAEKCATIADIVALVASSKVLQ